MTKLKVVTFVGTRPEIIKLSRVIAKLDIFTNHTLVHTGQNYDYELNQIFFDDLEIRMPDYFLEAAGSSSIETIGNTLIYVDKILDKINDEEKGIFDSSEKVFRPWGWYETIDGGNNYQVKRIHVYPKEQLSVQKHFHRSERWVVIKGEAEIQVGDNIERYPVGSMISIGKEVIHSLANTTDSEVEIIEVQLGSYLGEDDIVRYSDKYGRD